MNAINVQELPDFFKEAESLTEKLALLHRRKAWLNAKIPILQNTTVDIAERANHNYQLAALRAEQSSISEMVKEHNTLYNNTVQRQMIALLAEKHRDIYNELLTKVTTKEI